jgi:NADH:ubiquinone oxidoreductase subunit K
MNPLTITNSKKAAIIALLNAVLFTLGAFGLTLSDEQQGAIGLLMNAILATWVAFTYKDSPNRAPDAEGF